MPTLAARLFLVAAPHSLPSAGLLAAARGIDLALEGRQADHDIQKLRLQPRCAVKVNRGRKFTKAAYRTVLFVKLGVRITSRLRNG